MNMPRLNLFRMNNFIGTDHLLVFLLLHELCNRSEITQTHCTYACFYCVTRRYATFTAKTIVVHKLHRTTVIFANLQLALRVERYFAHKSCNMARIFGNNG